LDFREEDQRQNLPDARPRLQAGEGLALRLAVRGIERSPSPRTLS
jgi:hypothetical protein